MTLRARALLPLTTVILAAMTAACETTIYDVDGDADAGTDAATDTGAGPRKDAGDPAPIDAATRDAENDASTDGQATVDGASDAATDGQAVLDAGPTDAGAPATIAIGALPATTTYSRSQFMTLTSPSDPICMAPPLGGSPSGATQVCCFTASNRVYPNAARIVVKQGGLVCLEAGASSACAPLGAGAPGVASAQISEGNSGELTRVAKAWGMMFFGGGGYALALDAASKLTVTPTADGTSAKVVFNMQTSYGSPPGCTRGEGSWMHATVDVPLIPAP